MSSTESLSGSEVFEGAILRFEREWRNGDSRPDIAAFLPASGDSRVELLVELAHIDLEFRLSAGEPARAADYLVRFPELLDRREAANDLILTEYRLLERAGRAVAPTAFLNGYPEHRTELFGGLSAASDTISPTPHSIDPPAFTPVIPDLEIERELGRGGMGVVFLAFQPALNRRVAVKTLRAGPAATVAERARFQREAEAIARLDHPHIVPIYKVGEWKMPGSDVPVPYFVMKFYSGGSLDTAPADGSFDHIAGLVETVARAVDHAHRRGVLHRDLKPSNILLDEHGQPHVADLGLASVYDPNAAASSTAAVVGTPAYMAPEQATSPAQVTTAADVYGLGAVLYQLLTAKPPFLADTPLAILHRLTTTPPERPRAIRRAIPADLETVCLKCLEKEPHRRYASAAELADDLGRWRTGHPIAARPASAVERLWRTVRRNPIPSALMLVAFGSLVATVATLAVSYVRIREKELATSDALCKVTKAQSDLSAVLERERRRLAVEQVASAGRFWDANQSPQAWQMLDQCSEPLRRWEWHHLDAKRRNAPLQLTGHTQWVRAATFLGDDAVAAVDATGMVRVWPLSGSKKSVEWAVGEPVLRLAADPNGTWLAAAGAGKVTVWSASDHRLLRTLDGQNWVAVSADGTQLAAGHGNGVRVWDCKTWEQKWEAAGHTRPPSGGVFAPDGGRLVTFALDRTVRIWDAKTGKPAVEPRTRPISPSAVTYSGDGQYILESYSGVLNVVSATTGESVRRIEHAIPGRLLLAAGPTADQYAVTAPNGEIVLRSLDDPRAVRHLRGHSTAVSVMAIRRDGKRLVSVGADNAVRVWDLGPDPTERTLARLGERVARLGVSPDGKWVAVSGDTTAPNAGAHSIRLYDTATGAERHSLPGYMDVVFADDSRHLFTVTPNGGVVQYRVADGEPVRTWTIPDQHAHRLALRGDRLAVGTVGGTVTILNPESADVPPPLLTGIGAVEGLAFHPRENHLAVGSRARTCVWDVAKNKAVCDLPESKGAKAVSFDARGDWLVALDLDRTVRRYDPLTGERIGTLSGNVALVSAMAVHPDGTRIATHAADGTVKIWDVETGRDVFTIQQVEHPSGAVAWNAEGTHLFTADTALRVRVGGGP
jgi:eukaryotic-like serine/threonine-protein kinase